MAYSAPHAYRGQYVPVYPPSHQVSPIGHGHVPLPPSPYGHAVHLDPYGYAAPYVHQSPSAIYNALPFSYPSGGALSPDATQLHGLLQYSRNPRIVFDLSAPLEFVRHADGLPIPRCEESASACLPPSSILRVVCAQLPWVIDIDAAALPIAVGQDAHVTVADVLRIIHAELQVRVTGPEWLISGKRQRETVAAAFRTRVGNDRAEYAEGVKRVDWLGPNRFYMGLTKVRTPSPSRSTCEVARTG